jgi:hypothetical protein
LRLEKSTSRQRGGRMIVMKKDTIPKLENSLKDKALSDLDVQRN